MSGTIWHLKHCTPRVDVENSPYAAGSDATDTVTAEVLTSAGTGGATANGRGSSGGGGYSVYGDNSCDGGSGAAAGGADSDSNSSSMLLLESDWWVGCIVQEVGA